MGKGKIIALSVLALIIMVAGIVAYPVFFSKTITAQLYIDEGEVQVDTGNGWQQATDEMELTVKDKVRTLAGKATLILMEASVIRLGENTEISLDQLSKKAISLKQSAGETWNKVERLAGLESYKIETPTTVATVRGTGFLLGINSLKVGEGTVALKTGNNEEKFTEFEKATISEGKITRGRLTPEERELIIEHIRKDITALRRFRFFLLKHEKGVLKFARKKYGLDDAKLEQILRDIDDNKISEKEILRRIPVKSRQIKKALRITRQIKGLQERIQRIKAEGNASENPSAQ